MPSIYLGRKYQFTLFMQISAFLFLSALQKGGMLTDAAKGILVLFHSLLLHQRQLFVGDY